MYILYMFFWIPWKGDFSSKEWADEVYASIGKETTWSIAQAGCDQGWRLKSRESKSEIDLSIHGTGVNGERGLGNGERGLGEVGLLMESSPDLHGSRADETSFHLARWITSCILFCRNTFGSWDHPESIGKHLQTIERGLAPPWLGFSVLTYLESMTISLKWRLLWVFTSWAHLTMAPCHPTAFLPGSCRCVAPRKVVLQWKQSSRISAWRLPSLARAGVCDGFLCSPG